MRQAIHAIATWAAATAVILPVCLFAALMLAGPHSDLLPGPLAGLLLGICWLLVIGGPVWAAVRAWRRAGAASRIRASPPIEDR